MDLLLRGRGADISARAPLWFVRVCGAAIAFTAFIVADQLGLTDVTGFSPLMLGLGAAVIGALTAPGRFGAVLWIVTLSLAFVAAVVAFTPIVRTPAMHFVRIDSNEAPVDAIVVLSGSMTQEGLITEAGLIRLMSGIAEARRRHVAVLALSIIDFEADGVRVSSERDQQALVARLAPDLEVRFVRNVKSSRDEALQFAALGRTFNWQRVALVTSPLHTRRACRTFEVAGLPVTCTPAEPREYSLTKLGGAHARLNVFRDVMYETMATLWYSSRGWL